jgi:hypothetical protein
VAFGAAAVTQVIAEALACDVEQCLPIPGRKLGPEARDGSLLTRVGNQRSVSLGASRTSVRLSQRPRPRAGCAPKAESATTSEGVCTCRSSRAPGSAASSLRGREVPESRHVTCFALPSRAVSRCRGRRGGPLRALQRRGGISEHPVSGGGKGRIK